MKKHKTKFYLKTFLLIHILVYFFKIDRDIFASQEYFNQPNQTYTEQPLSKNVSYFGSFISSFLQFSKSDDLSNSCIENIAFWNSIFLSYNSRICHLLNYNEFYLTPTIKTIAVLHRQNIYHKSSEDEELEYRFIV